MDYRRLLPTDKDYPAGLRHLTDAPRQIYLRGDAGALRAPCLAVVGSRKTTPYGRAVTGQLVRQAAGRGITIISGLAIGIDATAHQAALEAGGRTVAVLGSGIDQLTPVANEWLGRQILERGGAVISEYPPGSAVHKHQFIARNRLVAGLSRAVLITEAAARSGSLHTAGFALDLGIPVLAVPGPIQEPLSAGTNHLLKTGALVTTELADILMAMNLPTTSPATQILGDNPEQTIILKLMGRGITDATEIQSHSRLPPSIFSQCLTMLEIKGQIRALGNGHWSLK